MTIWQKANRYLLGMLAAMPWLAIAADVTMVKIGVTVYPPLPCIINENQPMHVNFGDVMTNQVDGINYRMPVQYTLFCYETASNALKLQLVGNGASFDSSVLQTNIAGLGIELQEGNRKLGLNNWVPFTYPTLPSLWAVPVKQRGVSLSGGPFIAGVTMKVTYQ